MTKTEPRIFMDMDDILNTYVDFDSILNIIVDNTPMRKGKVLESYISNFKVHNRQALVAFATEKFHEQLSKKLSSIKW